MPIKNPKKETEENPKKEIEENPKKGTEIFRPYARLISILGDQLITNKWVGVIELVKNCYDADAQNVTVRFLNFDDPSQPSVIEIEDDGDGMTLDIILNVWMKPATPNKLNKKKSEDQRFTSKGRLMQGDKGVGRFAIYKLGNYVEIFTKTVSTPEVNLKLNFQLYAQNDEFSDKKLIEPKFLDEIKNEWKVNDIPERIEGEKGTLIRISDTRNSWKIDELEKLAVAFHRMIPPVIPNLEDKISRDFDVCLYWDEKEYVTNLMKFEDIIKLAPFTFEGSVDEFGKITYIYKHHKEIIEELDLFRTDEAGKYDVWSLREFKRLFLTIAKIGEKKNQLVVRRRPNIGEFSFYFYAYDWNDKKDLKSSDEAFIKDNSVYLYRDYTRVYPYGEKGIDWLLLSKLRAEDRAGLYFSYNDLIGFIFIGQENNPRLRDAANREGLVNIEGASDDFIALIQATLKIMKFYVDIDKRKNQLKKERAFVTANQRFTDAFEDLKFELIKTDNEKTLVKAQKFFKTTNDLVSQYKDKLTIAQELAGVGMAVEKSTHDLSLLIRKIIQNATDIVNRYSKGKLPATELRDFFNDLVDNLEFLYQEVQILQPLFRVARKTTKNVSIRDAVERVQRYFRRDLANKINFVIEGTEDIKVKTNLGLILQVFINLTDNSIYWLNQGSNTKREIRVQIDSLNNRVIFADNGVGINEDLSDVIFLEFYSTKSDGRGLGLYIIKELLERINVNISLVTTEQIKILPGANFLIQFNEAE